MSDHGITAETLLSTFPTALQASSSTAALAQGAARLLAQRPAEIDLLRLYAAIDRLPEPLLDLLACDFKVDWWDPDYSIEEKRRTLKNSWRVHRHMGTKAAVETAIQAIYPDSIVEEWWQYGGDPYHFRLRVDATEAQDAADAGKRRKVLARVDCYKSLRSHSDGVTYLMRPQPVHILAGGAALGSLRRETAPPIHLAADPPRGLVRVHSGGGLAGRRCRMEARLSPPELPRHGARGYTGAGGAYLGRTAHMTAHVAVPAAVAPIRTSVQVKATAGIVGMYQKIIREVPIYGTLE